MYKNILSVLILLTFVLSCTPKMAPTATSDAPPPPPPPPLPSAMESTSMNAVPMDPKVRIGKLSNGMTYYIRPNLKPDNRAELRLAVKAGSMQEDDNQLGLAHFIEHMAFNGSTHFSKNELVDYLEKVGTRFGADLNAS
ncbi:MAG TPA: insulinase family protein, partial [Saprospiraceae bacterium]|nr:insulinase family protein [Saprospiraceae bacterium]